MEQQNQGKISIQEAERHETELVWGGLAGVKEYLYYGEAKEAAEMLNWETAEEICNKKMDSTPAILIKTWRKADDDQWQETEERVLLLFMDERNVNII